MRQQLFVEDRLKDFANNRREDGGSEVGQYREQGNIKTVNADGLNEGGEGDWKLGR